MILLNIFKMTMELNMSSVTHMESSFYIVRNRDFSSLQEVEGYYPTFSYHSSWCLSQIQSPISQLESSKFTCIEFNHTGDLLAAGCKDGKINLFRANPMEDHRYYPYCDFTSHESEFDYLKSIEIDEKINCISWLRDCNSSRQLLSANDNTIKLWRLSERHLEAFDFNVYQSDPNSIFHSPGLNRYPTTDSHNSPWSSNDLKVPRFRPASSLIVEARPRKSFVNAHAYHINSLSLNSDQESFLSSDDLRINIWNLEVPSETFIFVDLKPSNMKDLSQVITSSMFHPIWCHLLAYSTSKGLISLCDMRAHKTCEEPSLTLSSPNEEQNVIHEITAGINDFNFSNSGYQVLGRDFFTLKGIVVLPLDCAQCGSELSTRSFKVPSEALDELIVWDIRKGPSPCETYQLHEPFRNQVAALYESETLFDKFLCSWSPDDRFISTGSYSRLVFVFDRIAQKNLMFDLDSSISQEGPIDPPIDLVGKRFISLPDPICGRFGISSLYTTTTDLLTNDDPNSNSDSPIKECNASDSDKQTPLTGSKRRKQTLPAPSPNEVDNDSLTERIDDDPDVPSCATETPNNGPSPCETAHNKLTPVTTSTRVPFSTFHPSRLSLIAASDDRLFVMRGSLLPLSPPTSPTRINCSSIIGSIVTQSTSYSTSIELGSCGNTNPGAAFNDHPCEISPKRACKRECRVDLFVDSAECNFQSEPTDQLKDTLDSAALFCINSPSARMPAIRCCNSGESS